MNQSNTAEDQRPNKPISVICGISALLSILLLFLPLGVMDHAYTASICQFAIGGIKKEYFGASDFHSFLLLFSLILSSVLLLLWAIFSFKRTKKAAAIGIFASIYYVIQAFVFRSLANNLYSTRYLIPCFAVCMICVVNIVLAILQYLKKKGTK